MCKEGWCVELGQEGCRRVGGTLWNALKMGGTEKMGREKREQLGQGVGALKMGDWNPFRNYGLLHKLIL